MAGSTLVPRGEFLFWQFLPKQSLPVEVFWLNTESASGSHSFDLSRGTIPLCFPVLTFSEFQHWKASKALSCLRHV